MRKYVGLKQNVFSQRIGISRSLLSLIELGNSNPTVETLKNIANEFSISGDFFLTEIEEINAYPIKGSLKNDYAYLNAYLSAYLKGENSHENVSLISNIPPGGNVSLNVSPIVSLNAEKHQGPVVNMVQSEEIEYGGRRYPTGSPAVPAQNVIQLSLGDDDVVVIYKVGGQFKADLLAGALKPNYQAIIDQLKADITELKRFYNVK